MKKSLVALFIHIVASANGASVFWNYLESYGGDSGNGLTAFYWDSSVGYTEFSFSVNNKGVVSSSGLSGLAWSGIVDYAIENAIVNAEAFSGNEHFTYQHDSGRIYGSDYTFSVDKNSSFYLMFQTSTYSQEDDPYYGWAYFGVDGNYNVSLLSSAIDLDGGAMIVGGGAYPGATPEPTSGVLLTLGLAALGLRRRDTKRFCQNGSDLI